MADSTAADAGIIAIGSFTVNRLGFGAMRITGEGVWGEPADRANAEAVLRRARELHVTLFDTADAYGPEISENLLCETLAPYDGLLIATKGGLTRPGPGQWVPDCSPQHLRAACEASLKRLDVETMDLYQLHAVDPNVPIEDSLKTLVELQNEGKIRHIGLSNVEPEQLEKALELAEIVSVQNNYNVGNREHEDVLKMCEARGIAFLPYFPLGSGDLTAPDGLLQPFADRLGVTSGQVALAWLLHHSEIIAPIPGTSSIEHLEENIAAARLVLSDADMRELDNLEIAA